MRVALVVPSFEVGGVEMFLVRLARELRARGHGVDLIATDERGAWWPQLAAEGIHGECLGRGGLLPNVSRIRPLANRLAGYDIALLNHSRLAQATVPWLAGGVAAIPVFHNDHPAIYEVGAANEPGWNVGVSVGLKVHAEVTRRVPTAKIVMIPYGVDLPRDLERRAGWSEPLRLLYLGRLLHAQKGVLLVPEILSRLVEQAPEFRVTIAGDGPDAGELSRRVARDPALAARVTMVGAVTNQKAYELMLSHHVLVAPSFHEGLGINILEAMACGCVPVVSRLAGVTDMTVAEGESGFLVPPGDVSGFAQRILALATDRDRWVRMSGAGIERTKTRFSVEAMTAAYLRLFEGCLAGERSLSAGVRQRLRGCNEALSWRDWLPSALWRAASAAKRWCKALR